MLSKEEKQKIRDLYYRQGINSIVEIARITGFNRKTVTKYIDMEASDVSAESSNDGHHSKLDPYKPLIDSWLTADMDAPRKERHNARKIHKRLTEEAEGFDCSYRTVAVYVAEWKSKKTKETKGHR
ncbi:MAG: hypothetical protein K6E53_08575 [Lachnospiraceae bacterium]|nr:hypothetical protein [Lachnospiraceae bacterium]